ncbi:hypothetical protein ACFVXG_28540 [Kitasatospora sp. NPDC058162]|uniref:hypothetical protein n=1 Tax=Kitasatospora sp. NPDC058162 TaxID=3346362 RepID=UPI0036DF986E
MTTRKSLAALAVLIAAAGTLAQGGTAQAATRAAGQCGGNVADYTYPARAYQFDDVISTWLGISAVQFNDDMTLTVTSNATPATVSGAWELHDPNGPNPAKKGVVTFYTTVSPPVQGDGVASIYWYTGFPNCNPTAADPAKKLFQIYGDVQMQPVYSDGSYGPLSKLNAYQADR